VTRSTKRVRTAVVLLLSTVPFYLASACSGSCGKGGDTKKNERTQQPLTAGATIPTPPERAGYVTNNGSDSITVIDRDSNDGASATATTTVSIDFDPDAHEAPHHLAINAKEGNVFVALAFPPAPNANKKKDPHAAHGGSSDLGKLARLDLKNLSVRATVDVDENPGDVVLTHDRTRVLVTHYDMKRAMDVAAKGAASPATMFAQLIVLDAKTMDRVGARPVCTAPHGVVTTKDDKTAFIACYGSDELAIVDLSSPQLPTSRIPLGASQGVPGVPRYGPYSATLSPDEKLVVVANLEGQDVRIFDRAEKKFLADKVITLSAKAFMPAFLDDRTILVPTQAPDGLVRVDLEQGKVVGRGLITKAQCALPHVVRVAKDNRVYLVCEGDHTGPGAIVELDRESLAVKKRWVVGVYPDGIEFPE